ncbi:MAG: hypothetical protein ACRCZ2_12105, partial [Fusobacteriaceae bacterium]
RKEHERYNASAGGRSIVTGAIKKVKLLEQGFNTPYMANQIMNVNSIADARMLQNIVTPNATTGQKYFDFNGAVEVNDTYIDRHIIQDALIMFNPKTLHPIIIDESSIKSQIMAYDMVPGMAPYMENLYSNSSPFQPVVWAETDVKIVNGQPTYLAKNCNLKIMAMARTGMFMDGRGIVSSCVIKFESLRPNPNYNPAAAPIGNNKMYIKGTLSDMSDYTGRNIAFEEDLAEEYSPLF